MCPNPFSYDLLHLFFPSVGTPEGPGFSISTVPPHRAFFEALGSLPERSAEWRAALAGLVTLRYLDAWADTAATAADLDTERQAVEKAIAVLPANAPERIYLAGLIDASTAERAKDLTRVVSLLLGYGRALQRRSGWALAADVFMRAYRVCAQVAEQPVQRELAAAAALRAGECYRELGELATAARAFDLALAIGRDSNSAYLIRRVQAARDRLGGAPGDTADDEAAALAAHGSKVADRPVELARSIEAGTRTEATRSDADPTAPDGGLAPECH